MDLTDRKNGLRLVIEVKNGFNPQAVLQQLYKYTPMVRGRQSTRATLLIPKESSMGVYL